jgi:hypothetical protein
MAKKNGFPKWVIGKNHDIKIQYIKIRREEKSGQKAVGLI